MQLTKPRSIGCFRFFEISDWTFTEEEAEHGPNAASGDWKTSFTARFEDSLN